MPLAIPESVFDNFIRSIEALKPVLPTVEDSYRMGWDYAINGPNDQTWRFRLFATPEHTRAWEKGKSKALRGK